MSTQLEQMTAAGVAAGMEAAAEAERNGYNVKRMNGDRIEYTDPRINMVTAMFHAFWETPNSTRDQNNQADIAAFGAAVVAAIAEVFLFPYCPYCVSHDYRLAAMDLNTEVGYCVTCEAKFQDPAIGDGRSW